MKKLLYFFLISFIIALYFQLAFSQSYASTYGDMAAEASVDSVVTIFLAGDRGLHTVGSGLVVNSNGYILTAYHLVKDAREIRIRLRNGEIYDKAEIVSTDERRNIAIKGFLIKIDLPTRLQTVIFHSFFD